MKYLKQYKVFESIDLVNQIKELFVDLEDQGFGVRVYEFYVKSLDFSDKNTMSEFEASEYFKSHSRDVDEAITVGIEKVGEFSLPDPIDLEDMIETLKFAESYAKEELSLDIKYITVESSSISYYKSIEDLLEMDDYYRGKILSITIHFNYPKKTKQPLKQYESFKDEFDNSLYNRFIKSGKIK